MWNACLLLACLAALASCDPVKYQDCGSVTGKIVSVDITPCPQEPCGLKHNTNITVKVEVTANAQVTSAKTEVHGVIGGVAVPFPVPSDACKDMACPVNQGTTATYNNAVFVQPSYPKLKLIVKWEVKDQDGKDVFCFVVPAEVTD